MAWNKYLILLLFLVPSCTEQEDTLIEPLCYMQQECDRRSYEVILADTTNGEDNKIGREFYIKIGEHFTYHKGRFVITLSCDTGTVIALIEGTIERIWEESNTLSHMDLPYKNITEKLFNERYLRATPGTPTIFIFNDNLSKLAFHEYLRIKVFAAASGTGDWKITYQEVGKYIECVDRMYCPGEELP